MKKNNLNKPTSVFWSKVILVCTTISGFGASTSYFMEWKEAMLIFGVFGMLGAVLPVLLSDGSGKAKAISWIVITVLFSSCSAQKQLARAERLINKAEAQGAK